jgi:hypothetical protein
MASWAEQHLPDRRDHRHRRPLGIAVHGHIIFGKNGLTKTALAIAAA